MISRTRKYCTTKQITMKKLIFIFFVLSIITSCDVLKKNNGVPDYQLGMNEQDFTASHKNNLSIVEATQGQTVYRRITGYDGYHVTSYMYYYFENNKLIRMRRMDNPSNIMVVGPGR